MTGQNIVFSELTDSLLPDLIDAIAKIGHETGAHNQDILDLELWKWQYEDQPTGTSYTYIARHDGLRAAIRLCLKPLISFARIICK